MLCYFHQSLSEPLQDKNKKKNDSSSGDKNKRNNSSSSSSDGKGKRNNSSSSSSKDSNKKKRNFDYCDSLDISASLDYDMCSGNSKDDAECQVLCALCDEADSKDVSKYPVVSLHFFRFTYTYITYFILTFYHRTTAANSSAVMTAARIGTSKLTLARTSAARDRPSRYARAVAIPRFVKRKQLHMGGGAVIRFRCSRGEKEYLC